MENKCVYCGSEVEIEREHVIPAVYYTLRSFDPTQQWIVPACRTCNSLAGSNLYFSIPEKAIYIAKRYKIRFKKIIGIPYWSEEELRGLGYILRKGIEESMMMRLVVLRRIQHIESVTEYTRDYLRPKWVEEEYKKYRLDLLKKRKAKKPTSTSDSRA